MFGVFGVGPEAGGFVEDVEHCVSREEVRRV